jgi:hypothetical protein
MCCIRSSPCDMTRMSLCAVAVAFISAAVIYSKRCIIYSIIIYPLLIFEFHSFMTGVFSSKNLKIGHFLAKISTKLRLPNREGWMPKRVRMGGKPCIPPKIPVIGLAR